MATRSSGLTQPELCHWIGAKQILIAIICACLPLSPALSKSGDTDSGYAFELMSSFSKDQKIVVSSKGVRVEQTKYGLVFIARPPDWHVYVFLPAQKKIYTGGQVGVQPGGRASPAKIRQSVKPGVLLGLKVAIETLKPAPAAVPVYTVHEALLSDWGKNASKHPVRDVWIAQWELSRAADLDIPIGAVNAVNQIYGLEKGQGMPVQQSETYSNGQVKPSLTLIGWRRASVPASSFVVPTSGYSRTANLQQLEGLSVRNQFDEVSEDLRLGEPFGTTKKQ